MMNSLSAVLSCEMRKVLRSKLLWISILAFCMIPVVGGFFMYVLKDPEFARKAGLIGTKAQFAGTADWPSLLQFLSQAVSIGGLLLFGFITSWVFGREYSDHTVKDLLSLPISRNTIVLSKYAVVFLWCFFLSSLVFLLGLLAGKMVVLPGWSNEILREGLSMFGTCALLTILLCTPVAFFASCGRGYLSPLGFVVLSLILAQIIATAGYGHLFPWAVPALYSRISGDLAMNPGAFGYSLVVLTSLVGMVATGLWWRYADQT